MFFNLKDKFHIPYLYLFIYLFIYHIFLILLIPFPLAVTELQIVNYKVSAVSWIVVLVMKCTFLFWTFPLWNMIMIKRSVICVHVVFPCHIIINLLELSYKSIKSYFPKFGFIMSNLSLTLIMTDKFEYCCYVAHTGLQIFIQKSENQKSLKPEHSLKGCHLHAKLVFCKKQDPTHLLLSQHHANDTSGHKYL